MKKLFPTDMTIMSWLKKQREDALAREKLARGEQEPPVPITTETSLFARKQLWTRCEFCGVILYISHLKHYDYTCKDCASNVRINSTDRIESLIDDNTWRPMFELLSAGDPLKFHDKKPYTERLGEAQERTGLQDAVQIGTGLMGGIPVALGVLAFDFMAGSMGSVVGEKIARLIEHATKTGVILILVSASGGARMQEGILSLMQMGKISAALYNYQQRCHLFYISILSSPTTGGVTASFAMLGDIIIAEPKAIIGFAGRRVIEQTLGEILPDDFQTAEYLMDHGLVDAIIGRKFLKPALIELCGFYADAPYREAGHSM
jgi:acetyl-CoA carboxylase carboxyl transferase subunit beta